MATGLMAARQEPQPDVRHVLMGACAGRAFLLNLLRASSSEWPHSIATSTPRLLAAKYEVMPNRLLSASSSANSEK